MILDPIQLQKNIARLECGGELGTAFLIDKDKAVTAYHCIKKYFLNKEIKLEFLNIDGGIVTVLAEPLQINLSRDLELDVVILQLKNPLPEFEYLTFSDTLISNRAIWNTYGYPIIEKNDGMPLIGKFRQKKNEDNVDMFDLILEYDGPTFQANGLSGSPLIINGVVKGVITYDRGKMNTLGAVSLDKITPLLKQLDIEFINNELSVVKKEVIDNYSTELKIKECIDHNESGYIFVKGVPGSGKTTLADNLYFEDENIEIVNKYFLKEINENYNIQYKASEETFGKWFVNSISKLLYNTLIEDKTFSYKELLEHSQNYYSNLSTYARNNEKKYVFIIDGIDEILNINEEKLKLFFGVLPPNLSRNIFIIIFGNNENNLPILFKSNLNKQRVINIYPLDFLNVMNFIKKNVNSEELEHALIRKLANKSEGNPLYLRYLINYLNGSPSEINEEFVNSIPSFNGEIINYYSMYWDKIKYKKELIKLLAILSRVRNQISREDLIKMFPGDERFVLGNHISIVSHLLGNNCDKIFIYHNSFLDFVKKETSEMDSYVHQIISKFCIDNLKKRFSLENILYHLVNAELDYKKEAVKRCNQEWLDSCSIENIHPDIMIIDIKNILEFSIDDENFPEVIRILLLLQRLKFRNEKMFKTFSIEMARALYEMKKEKDVLTYIIREGSLVESILNDDVIYLLRKFVKDGFTKESEILFEAIRNRCIEEYENKGFKIDTLFLDIKSVMLFPEYNPLKRLDIFNRLLIKTGVKNGGEIIQWLSGEMQSWFMREKDVYGDIESLKKMFGAKIDEKSIEPIIKVIISYIETENKMDIKTENKSIYKASGDLEALLIEYKIVKKDDAIEALIQYSKNTNLLDTLIKNGEKKEFKLRANNGVDFNYKDFLAYKNFWINLGYSDKMELYPEISFSRGWEGFFLAVIKAISFITGKCYRAKAEGTKEIETIEIELEKILDGLKFELKDRVKWKRSYFIPEAILPLIYKQITYIYINFIDKELQFFTNRISNIYQLGIYNEGYRRTLFSISNEIIRYKNIEKKAFPIIKELELFIDKYVLNRWERTKDFLKIVELYGKIDSVERANSVFKKMLRTSMGPSWYKESQFTLMGTGIKSLVNLPEKEKYLKKILSYLDYSSGEMTFQRYVRDEKEEFVGIISNILGYKKSLEYFKRLTYPSSELLIKNTIKDTPDMVEENDGYVQGTNEINLQDAMRYFIRESKSIDPYIKYGLTEIFIQGDERYFEEYTEFQIEILYNFRKNPSKDYQQILNRVKRQFVSELDNERRKLYIQILKKSPFEETAQNIIQEIKDLNVFELPLEVKDELGSWKEDSKEKDPSLSLAEEELKYENFDKAKKILSDRISQINKERGEVFYWSRESKECLSLLESICNTDKEILKCLKPVLLNPNYSEEWNLVDSFLNLAGGKIDDNEADLVMNNILDHINQMISMPNEIMNQFEWIEDVKTTSENNEVEKFIIWLTNLPSGLIYKKRAIEVLTWIGEVKPKVIIPLLIEKSLENDLEEACDISSNILHVLSRTDCLEYIWYCICLNEDLKAKILNENHFIIKSCFLEITKEAKKNKLFGADEFLMKIEKTFFKNNSVLPIKKLELNSYSDWITSELNYLLEAINRVAHVDEKFIKMLEETVKKNVFPLDLNELKKTDKIIERSYSIGSGLSQVYRDKIEHAINLIISEYLTRDNYDELKLLLRNYNPSFPERSLSFERPHIFNKVNDIFLLKSETFEDCIFYKDKLILHFNEIVANREAQKGKRIEIISFLIDAQKEIPTPTETLYDYFTSNLLPDEVKIEMDKFKGIYPLILKASFGSCRTSWYTTPSQIHPKAKEKYNITDKIVQQKSWRDGRILDVDGFGMQLHEGSLLTINKSILSKFNDNYRLMHLIKYNHDKEYRIIDFNRQKVYGG